jgi:hypothetical protein
MNKYMKMIELTQGKFAEIDDSDYKKVKRYAWFAHRSKKKNLKDTWYAGTNICIDGKNKTVHLHTFLMNASRGHDIDHFDGNGLNNQRSNLRVCSRSENLMNQRKAKGMSRYKGVSFFKTAKKWRAQIKGKHLGLYITEKEAAKAYNSAAICLFGKFSRINLIN